ncbi:ATP-binding cassette domain-containing protein [Rhodovulum sp. DZ06]|uniref:ATP-binding cassette domain-containing protein n=1 Tax=Rhodovulum sp. DZ06 TaxID=3425126 RepID=UPI003D347E6D
MDVPTTPRARRVLGIYGWTLLLLVMAPVLIMIPVSFGPGAALSFPPEGLSFEWYENLATDRRWSRAALLSLQVAAMATGFAILIGAPAALAVHRTRGRLAELLKIFFIAPMIVPIMVIGVGFYMIFAQLRLLGVAWPLALAHAMIVLPFVVMPLVARLASLDPALERASASLGAGALRTLFTVTLPLPAPAILASAVFAFIFSFDEVVLAQLLAGPRFETLPRKIYESITQNGLDKTITAIASAQFFLVAGLPLLDAARRRIRLPRRAAAAAAPGVGRPPRSLSAAATAEAAPPVPRAALRSPAPTDCEPPLLAPSTAQRPPMLDTSDARAPAAPADIHGFGIQFQGLSKYYGDKAAASDVNLTIKPGEFMTILGPSGSGKTTLLMLIAGFIAPDAGRLMPGDRDISRTAPHQRDIGVVFQSYALFPHMNVLQNVAYPLRARGVKKAERERRARAALAKVHMEDFADRRISDMSGGRQQRVALARAISFDPRALLMDEPLAALDRELRGHMQTEIRRLQRELGQTVIFATHDQEEALNMSDRVAVMNHGKIQQVATPKDLYQRPANSFVAGFFGESKLFHGTAGGAALTVAGRPLPLPERREGRAVLCVRPEQVRLAQAGDAAPDAHAPDWALDGRVTDARFLGAILRLELETVAGTVVATRRTGGDAAAPGVGALMKDHWDPAAGHVMAS